MLLRDGEKMLQLVPRGGTLVEIEVAMPEGSWRAVDPALEPRETQQIVRWLRQVARGRRPKELGFTEPNLAFECLVVDEPATIRVWFEGDLRPDWAPYASWDERDLHLDLTLPRAELARAADELTHELNRL